MTARDPGAGLVAWIAPVATGLLLAASAPPSPSPLLPFVALAPLAGWVATLPPGAAGALAVVRGGLLVGALQHGWGLRWLPGTLAAVAGPAVGWSAAAAVVAVLAGFTAAAVWALHRLATGPRPVPLAVALAVTWTALEWTLAHLPVGLAFPWAPLGLGLARWPEALGVAELAGVSGVTAWLAATSGLIADAGVRARSGRARPAWTTAGLALLVGAAPAAWGVARAGALDAPVVGRVAALALTVAPGGPALDRATTGMSAVERALAARAPGEADLIALPEMLLPLDLDTPAGAPLLARLRALAGRAHAPVLVGVLGVEGRREYNSALLVTAAPGADGEPTPFRADKRRLVPGAERASAVRAPWLAAGQSATGYTAGAGWPVARLGALRVGALVCYEVAFAADARRLVRNGANALVALTSDAWFGDGARGRAGVAQQTAHLALRAVETRTGAVRASNGGPALVLRPTGREEAHAEPGVAAGPLRASPRRTLFVRTGDLAGPAAVLLFVALLALSFPRRHAFSGVG